MAATTSTAEKRPPVFADRAEAGRALAAAVGAALARTGAAVPVVVGLARGGVPVAAEVARALGADLDVAVVRKVGHSRQPELAIGAVAAGGHAWIDTDSAVRDPGGLRANLPVAAHQAEEMESRIHSRVPAVPLAGRVCVLVDDGLATGATMRAALEWARAAGARRIVVAVPVADRSTLASVARDADAVACPHPRDDLWAVGVWYRDFGPVPEEEVLRLLAASREPGGAA